MPIFNRVPRTIYNLDVTQSILGLEFSNWTNDMRVCITSADGGNYYYVSDIDGQPIYLPYGVYNICVTRPGYIPWIYKNFYFGVPVQRFTQQDSDNLPSLISVAPTSSFANTRVKYTFSNTTTSVQLMLSNIDGTQVCRFALNPSANEDVVDLSRIPSGIYVAVLLVDGTPVSESSLRIMKY